MSAKSCSKVHGTDHGRKGSSELDRQADEAFKDIISSPFVFSHVVKGLIPGYEKVPVERIPSYVVPPADGKRLTERESQDQGDTPGSHIYFDIRSRMRLPGRRRRKGDFDLSVNLEGQKESGNMDRIVARSMHYVGMQLLEQLGDVFQAPYYELTRKAYSIWIVMNAKRELRNKIIRIRHTAFSEFGDAPLDPASYDKGEVVLVCLGDWNEEGIPEVLGILDIIFSPLDKEMMIAMLKDRYNLSLDEDTTGRINEMCNFSATIREMTEMKVKEEERAAFHKADFEKTIAHVKAIMKKLGTTSVAAMDLLDIPEDGREALLLALK